MSPRERKRRFKSWHSLSIEELVEAVRGISTERGLEDAVARGLDSRIRELKRIIEGPGRKTEAEKDVITAIEEHVDTLLGKK